MVVKKFSFPSFEEWSKNYDFSQEIGVFACRVAKTSWFSDGASTFEIAFSDAVNPLNVNVRQFYHSSITCDREDAYSLRNWYERVTEEINTEFAQYILSTYLEERSRWATDSDDNLLMASLQKMMEESA